MTTPPRRSRRNAYKSLSHLEARAKAVAAEETKLLNDDPDADDASFDASVLSDKGEDLIDSDFDEPEAPKETPDPDRIEKDLRAEELKNRKRSLAYSDPALKKVRKGILKKVAKKKVTIQLPDEIEPGKSSLREPGKSSLRKSTKVASARAAEARAERTEREEKRRKKRMEKESTKEEEIPLTQEELLEEAKKTEILNRESLKELLRLEEEKKRIPGQKQRELGEKMTLRSRGGVNTISFSKGVEPRKVLFPHLYEK